MSGRFAEYPEERLRVASVDSRTSGAGRRLRLALLDSIIEAGGPVAPSRAADAAGLTPREAERLARELADRNVIVLSPEGKVEFAYPVSAHPTVHHVTLADGRSFSAMCAVDAVGAGFTFRQDAVVESACHLCGTPVRVAVRVGKPAEYSPGGLHAVHADLSKSECWADSC